MALLLQLFSANDAAQWREAFAELIPDEELRIFPNVGKLEDIQYAAVFKSTEGLFNSLPSLKAIFTLLAGQEALLSDSKLPDVPIVRTDTASGSDSITETVLMHVLRHYRRLPDYASQQAKKEWNRLPQKPRNQTRVSFLGLGLLGLAAAERVSGYGFTVNGWSRTIKSIEGVKTFSGPEGLPQMLRETDILVNLLPLTPETRGILNRDAFKFMPTGSALISLGRGEHHPSKDLYWALDNGLLSSITLDVFDPEPPPPNARVWIDPRITLTPHVARAEYDVRGAVGEIARGIRELRASRVPQRLVDRKLGY